MESLPDVDGSVLIGGAHRAPSVPPSRTEELRERVRAIQNETPPIAETLVQQSQEEQMLRDAIHALSPQCRNLVHLLFFETPPRAYTEVAKELGLAIGSIGFTRQKCIERLRKQLDVLGFS